MANLINMSEFKPLFIPKMEKAKQFKVCLRKTDQR